MGGFSCKSCIFKPLCNPITRQPIVLGSCSSSQKTQQVFYFAMKKNLGGFVFFVDDIISGVDFGLFG